MYQVFVAIPFARDFDPVFETISGVCLAVGVKVIRIDEIASTGDLYQLIEREISRSVMVVADCTGDVDPEVTNPNVALEIGFARAMEKPVILLTQSIEALPFDLRTQRALPYAPGDEGLNDLWFRLRLVVDTTLRRQKFRQDEMTEEASTESPYLYLGVNEKGFEEYLSPVDRRETILVPGGVVPWEGGGAIEQPPFFVDKFPVTNIDYASFIDATDHRPPCFWDWNEDVQGDEPVVGVSWEDALAFARWAGKELLSSGEWLRAARVDGGGIYPWGDDDPHPGRAAYRQLAGKNPTRPCPVGQATGGASACGCRDMAGNVWEWLADWHEPGRSRLIAGGSVFSEACMLRCTSRFWADPSRPDYPTIGFRCLRRAMALPRSRELPLEDRQQGCTG